MVTDDAVPRRRRVPWARQRALSTEGWRRPAVAAALVVGVALAAAAGTVWAATAVPVGARDAAVLALLLGLEIGYVEALRLTRPRPDRSVRPRRGNGTSVAVVAGALLLSPAAAVVLPLLGHLYEHRRLELPAGPPYRVAYGVSALALAALAVWPIRFWGAGGAPAVDAGLPLVLLAVAVFALVDRGLAAAAAALTGPRAPLRRLLGGFDDNLLELATLALGGLAAAAVVATPWIVPMVLPAMIVMRRAALVPQLTRDAHVDGKTGLLNAGTWQERAAADLATARPDDAPRAVLVIDLDHFKAVNDTYGHIAGDAVLAAVADAVQGAVRSRDLVGRFGGEEFVVLRGSDGRRGRGRRGGHRRAHPPRGWPS